MGYNTKTEQINKQRYQQQATTIPSDTPSITHVWAYGKEEYHSDEGTVDTDVSGDGEWRGNQIKVAVSGTTIWAEFRGSDADNVVVTCKVTMRYSDGSIETQEKTAYNADSCARVDFSLTDYRKSVTVYTSYGWVNI